MSKRKPGMRSIDEWELGGLEIIAMREAAGNRLYRHQKAEREQLLEAHFKEKEKANIETLPSLEEDHRKQRIDQKFNHQYQTYLTEISDNPHQTVTKILDEAKPGRSELEVIFATQKLDQAFREQSSAIQAQHLDELSHLTALHKDKMISTEAFHQTLDAYVQEKQESLRLLQGKHTVNLNALDHSDKPLDTAAKLIATEQEQSPTNDNSQDQERHSQLLGDIHSNIPAALKDDRYFETPIGSILAMSPQDYEPPEQEFEFDLKEHFENAQDMSNSQDLSRDR